MNLGFDFRGGLERLPHILEAMVSRINTVWRKEHNSTTGGHTVVTATALRVGTFTGAPPPPPVGHELDWPDMLHVDGGSPPGKSQVQVAAARDIDIFTNGQLDVGGTAGADFSFPVGNLTFSTATFLEAKTGSVVVRANAALGDAVLSSTLNDVNVTALNGDVVVQGVTLDVAASNLTRILTTGGFGGVEIGATTIIDIHADTNVSVDADDSISLTADDDISIDATDDITIHADGDVSVNADGNATLTSNNIGSTTTVSSNNSVVVTASAVVVDGVDQLHLAFPATMVGSADPNTLDDYEEGTWTPQLEFGGATTGITYNARAGTYTKIGRQVTLVFDFELTSQGSATGSATITGAPFAAGSASVGAAIKVNFNAALVGSVIPWISGSTINVYTQAATSDGPIPETLFSNTARIIGTLTYFT